MDGRIACFGTVNVLHALPMMDQESRTWYLLERDGMEKKGLQ
jgi:hypothetical protein